MSTPSEPNELDLRASDAERRRTTDRLADAMAAGQLTPDEHAERMDRALHATTRRDLVALTADLPVAPPDPAVAAAEEARERRLEVWSGWRSWLGVAVLLNVIWLLSGLTGDKGLGYYWPAWPLGMWGAFLLVRTVMPDRD